MSYENSDGVFVRTGVDAADKASVSLISTALGDQSVIEVALDWEALPAFSSAVQTIASRYVKVPAGVLIEKIELMVDVDFDSAGDTATLNVGWVDADDGTSNGDNDAFVKAATVTELSVNTLYSSTSSGGTSPLDVAGPGTATTEAKFITWDVGTQNFSAGKGKLRIFYSTPDKATDDLGT
jgi:hypothetical protein